MQNELGIIRDWWPKQTGDVAGRRGSHLDRSAITLVVCEASLECGGVGDGASVVVGARMKF